MELPKAVIVGNGILNELPAVLNEVNVDFKNVIILTGPNVFKLIKNQLQLPSIEEKTLFVHVASFSEINRLKATISRMSNNVTHILGIGGGRVIDIGKMIAHMLNINFISVPTAPSHDGIASQFVSIKEMGRVHSFTTTPPYAIIVDVDIVSKAPKRLIASGVGDAIAKIVAVRDWKLANEKVGEYYGEYAANLSLLGAKLVEKCSEGIGAGDVESIRTLIEALISDGVAAGIAGSSRPCSGSEHLFSHALDLYATRHALHGEQVGVGTILMAYLHGIDFEAIQNTLKKAGAPTTYEELNIPKDDIIKGILMAKSVRPERYTILNEYNVTAEFAEKIAKKTNVI
ncbi:MAG: sn-glycerol-1-phosphate dehydrogenase [Candidatus Geothermarchaeota archaeon]